MTSHKENESCCCPCRNWWLQELKPLMHFVAYPPKRTRTRSRTKALSSNILQWITHNQNDKVAERAPRSTSRWGKYNLKYKIQFRWDQKPSACRTQLSPGSGGQHLSLSPSLGARRSSSLPDRVPSTKLVHLRAWASAAPHRQSPDRERERERGVPPTPALMARPPVLPWCRRRMAGGAKARRGRGVDDAEAIWARDGWRGGLSLARGRRRKPRSDAGLAAWSPATCLRPVAQSPDGVRDQRRLWIGCRCAVCQCGMDVEKE
jgi:hypothetical protein